MDTQIVSLLLLLLGCCSLTSATEDTDLSTCLEAPACNSTINIAIAFCCDSSGSMSQNDFNRIRKLVSGVILKLFYSSGTVQTGFASFGTHNYDSCPSLISEPLEAQKCIQNLTYRGSTTETHRCIDWAKALLEKEKNVNSKGVIVVISDGGSTFPNKTLISAAAAKEAGLLLITVGIGKEVNNTELVLVSSDGTVLSASTFGDVPKLITVLANKACTAKPPPPCPSNVQVDVGFCIDSSQSIGKDSFGNNSALLKQILSYFTISNTGVRVGISVYGTHNYAQTKGISGNQTEVEKAAANLPYRSSTTQTDTCITWATGALTAGGNVRIKFLVVITDGQSSNRTATLETAAYAKKLGIVIVVIAVGPQIDTYELTAVSSDGTYITVVDYSRLANYAYQVALAVCAAVTRSSG